MTTSRLLRAALGAAALPFATLVAPFAGAQGTLSGLGFGYPVGGASTRAAGAGGAFADFDGVSPRNPASIGGLPRTLLSVQTEPEYRTLRTSSTRERTTAQRIPLLFVGFPAPRGIGVALSASTLLDRSFSTRTQGTVDLGGQTFVTDDRTDVRGSIGDLRAAIGWRPTERFSVGFAGHLITGDNIVASSRQFPDTTQFGSVLDSSRVTYYGSALSIGADLLVVKGLAVSASYRSGNGMRSIIDDSVRTRANVPNRLGGSVRYDGIPGTIFAIGFEKHEWTRMRGLGSTLVELHDATNWSAGAEVAGPRMRGVPSQFRAGYANNTLPFGVNGRTVKESRIAGGIGLPIAGDNASIDLSVQRANRRLDGGAAREAAWLVGLGLQIRLFQ